MKNRRFTPMLIAAGLLSTLNLGLAVAQPGAAPAAKTNNAGQPRRRNAMVTKRILTAIEAKTGKALTADQKRQLNEAAKARQAAVDAAMEKFLTESATITGLTVEDLREINKPARRNGGAAGAPAAEPATPAQ